MVAEYTTTCYLPSAQRYSRLMADNLAKARALATWRQGMKKSWQSVRVVGVESSGMDTMHVGSRLEVRARVNLGSLRPEDVQVQLFHGLVDSMGDIPRPATIGMSTNGAPTEGGTWLFTGAIPCQSSGQHGFMVRILPRHGDLANSFEPGLVCWG
jgi:starch phosphorylase